MSSPGRRRRAGERPPAPAGLLFPPPGAPCGGCARLGARGPQRDVKPHAGSWAVKRVWLWSAANMGASRARILWRVVVPAAAPFIFAGLRIALPIAMIVAIITEMISSADGLGYLVMYSLASFKTDRMLAAVVVVSLLGLALDRLVGAPRAPPGVCGGPGPHPPGGGPR